MCIYLNLMILIKIIRGFISAEHVPCPVDDIVVDEDNKIVTTPAYMLAQNIAEAASGIDKLVSRVLVLAE